MLAYAAIRRAAQSAPRGARAVSTAQVRTSTPAASAMAPAGQNSAGITTTAKSIGNPAPSAMSHVKDQGGRLKKASRHFHANSSESSAGLNEPISNSAMRQAAKLRRMRDAKEMAGL